MNACSRVYTEHAGDGLVFSAGKQFPDLKCFLAGVVNRARKIRAVREAQNPAPLVLSEAEFTTIMKETTTNVIDMQRHNILALAFCTDLRASSIAGLQCNSFKEHRTADGRRMLTFIIGNMKNLPAEIDRCDVALFHQVIVQSSVAAACP